MADENELGQSRKERAPLDMTGEEFREAGHRLVDELADFFESFGERPVTRGEPANVIRDLIGRGNLPELGLPASELLGQVVPLLADHSLHNGHPRFFGYITSSAAPLGALADLVAASINANAGLWNLSPVASEIETQTVRWLAELIGFPVPCGGLMVSGGNMANFLGFLAARRARIPWDIRRDGLYADPRQLVAYASEATHTWIEKAADLTGIGTSTIRWVSTDGDYRMRVEELERRIERDFAAGHLPFVVVGTAGSVSTGAIDPLAEIAAISQKHGLWFHVDGAYGAPAAVLADAPADLRALNRADSVALDPHKWLYTPLEAACLLVRTPSVLIDAFSYRPSYYHFDDKADDAGFDYYEHGIQNSRAFRALKVWLCLRHVGRAGYEQMIGEDIALARHLLEAVRGHPELEAGTQSLSITTFRYRPKEARNGDGAWRDYLNVLNNGLLSDLQKGGETFLSKSVLDGNDFLRACIVNFRTRVTDVEALPEIVVRRGRQLDAQLRPPNLG